MRHENDVNLLLRRLLEEIQTWLYNDLYCNIAITFYKEGSYVKDTLRYANYSNSNLIYT